MKTGTGNSSNLLIGWAQADITPEENVLLAGQFYARVSEGVMDPVTATAMAIESVRDQGQVVMVSVDLACSTDELRDAVRSRIEAAPVAIHPNCIFIGATHAHSAPENRLVPYGMAICGSEYKRLISAPSQSVEADKFGVWPNIGLDVMSPADYLEFAAERIAEVIARAWQNRHPAGIAYGIGHAVVGRNRRLTYKDGKSRMYGSADTPEFSHVEGYEDHSVQAMMTYDPQEKLTGMIVNVPCPSQVSEHIYQISADYWHETRQELRQRFGPELHILPQCGPAGDLSPHVLVGKPAEQRMWRLKDRETDQNAPRTEIARKISNAISDIIPYAKREINWNPAFRHHFEIVDLPRRMISRQHVEEALEEALPFREQYEKLTGELAQRPELRKQSRWYTEITMAYRRMERGERVKKRFELQKNHPSLPVELHAVRLGDLAFATNPFELYLDYAVRMRELSRATQTFLIQKAGCHGTYLPSARSITHGGYGSVPASTDIGPEGGERLVEWTITTINNMFIGGTGN